MTPEPKQTFNQGDGVRLQEHIECRLAALQEYMEARFAAISRETEIARTGMEKRLDGMNEFRDALKDQSGRMVTRDELGVQMRQVNGELDELKKYKNTMEGKASQQSMLIALGFSIISIVITVVKWMTGA